MNLQMPKNRTTLRQRLALLSIGILLGILCVVLVDFLCVWTGVFPPEYDYGDPDLGAIEPAGTGVVRSYHSVHWRFQQSDTGLIKINERGFRTTRSIAEIKASPAPIPIAVTGDSHTDLPYDNGYDHPAILEKELRALGVQGAEVLSAGRGGYSPLQGYLYARRFAGDLSPKVFVLNLYTGNDFFDLVRIDDRPYFERGDNGTYSVHPPVWYRLKDPATAGAWYRKSRSLFLAGKILDGLGLSKILARMEYLLKLGAAQGRGLSHALSYIRELKASTEDRLAYPPAYPSQILNQYLFFTYFPPTNDESVHRLEYLLQMIKRENPGLLLVLSPIPSASLAGSLDADTLFRSKLEELNIDPGSLKMQEAALYDSSRALANREGWVFIDNLAQLRQAVPVSAMYMAEDLHISPAGSRIIGVHEATVLAGLLPGHIGPTGKEEGAP